MGTDSDMRSQIANDGTDLFNGTPSAQDESDLTSPDNLRKMVLNYLIHHCYTDTAIAFAKDGITGDLSAAENISNGASSSAGLDTRAKPDRASAKSVLTTSSIARQAHPLSAPPLSRDDSSMEIEVESLLPATSEQPTFQHKVEYAGRSNGHDSASSSHRTNGHEEDDLEEDDEEEGDISPELTAEDLRAVRERQKIRDYIIDGQIRQAMDLCNEHFPSVLNAKPNGSGKAVQSKVRATDPTATGSNRVLPAYPTSLEPDHLLLNLQIQVFIEAIRSASSSSMGSAAGMGSSPPLSSSGYLPLLAANTPGIAAAAISRSASPAPSSASSNGSGTSGTGSNAALNPALHSALAYAQGLYTSAQKLPSYWRAMYLKELEQVTALLAYTDVEHSPVRRFLHRSRKVALAEQVNSAILYRSGRPSQPLIESAVRQTSFVWSHLIYAKVPVPTSHPVFSLVSPVIAYDDPSTTPASTAPTSTPNAKKQQSTTKFLPPWDFRSFLAER